MQKPGIPAQQMQLTGTRERACGRAKTHSQSTRTTPRNLAGMLLQVFYLVFNPITWLTD